MGGNSQEPDLFAGSPGAISGLIRMSSFLLYREETFHTDLSPACRKKMEGQSVFLVPAVS